MVAGCGGDRSLGGHVATKTGVSNEDYGIARAYRDTGISVKLPVYGTGRIPVQERHCGTSEMLVPVEIDLENSTVPIPIPVPVARILLVATIGWLCK